ncbi:MAG: phospholipase effector Tle1 domain-containing protein, partial [Candidatus Acidiferrales bacterium]
MARNVLILSDGTGQAGGLFVEERRSNVYKLYRATRCAPDSSVDPAGQAAFYDPGLGSRPSVGGLMRGAFRAFHNFLSQATGYGLTTNIIDCVEAIYRLWQPGDRIFLFGFSRGAYTARCVGGVLALCGVPTRLADGCPMKYDSATARHVATIAVKKVYQHTASKTPARASAREKELLAQREELARQFRETYASRQPDKSDYPYFIGVFDTVAAVASPGSLVALAALLLSLNAAATTVLWLFHSAY